MLNPPVTSSVMKSGEKVWYFWVRSCGECGFTGHTLQCLGRYLSPLSLSPRIWHQMSPLSCHSDWDSRIPTHNTR